MRKQLEKNFPYFSSWFIVLTGVWIVAYAAIFQDPIGLASKNWPLIIVGIFGAMIGNITAIGGGIIFIPVLLFVYRIDPLSSLKLTFVTQAVGMTSGASGWLRRGDVPLDLMKWTVPPLILGSVISTFLIHPKPILIKGLFGPIAFITGLLVLYTLDRKGEATTLPRHAFLPLVLVSLIGGMITGWVAIGEGEIIAAFCMLKYGLNANSAIGLGVVLLSLNSILLAIFHIVFFAGVPWEMAAFTVLGVLWGGRLGPYLSQWMSIRSVKKFFSYIALFDGFMVMLQVIYVAVTTS